MLLEKTSNRSPNAISRGGQNHQDSSASFGSHLGGTYPTRVCKFLFSAQMVHRCDPGLDWVKECAKISVRIQDVSDLDRRMPAGIDKTPLTMFLGLL